MELTGILSFIGLFVIVLSALIGVAYYSLKESPEETSSDNVETKKNVRRTKKRDASKKQTEKPKKRKNSESSNNEHLDAPEEEPIVIIPDPFTNKLSSRFAGAQPKKLDSHKKSTDEPTVVHRSVKTEAKVEAKADKVKPQATVKPSKVTEPMVEKKTLEQKNESVKPIEVQVQAMVAKSNEVEKLNLKIRDMDKALNDKLTNINQLNRQNEELKIKLDDSKKLNAKIQSEFDAQKQTNQVIQKELTRLTTLVSSLDKEKLQLRHELELVRVQQTKPIENTDALCARIEQLSQELADRTNGFNQFKSKSQDLEARLVDSNEQNSNLFNRLQTQEALIKQLEIKLERSVPTDTFKQKESELNTLKNELKNLQSQIESYNVYGCQKDTEINCLRSKIDVLESQLRVAENNSSKTAELDDLRNQLQVSEARLKDFQNECDYLKSQNSAKDNQLEQFRSELDLKTTHANSLEALNNQLKSQLESASNNQTQTEQSSENIKNLENDLNVKNGRIEVLEKELGFFRRQIEQEANKFNEQKENLQNDLNCKNARNESLENELNQLRAELNQSRDQLGQKETELESLRCEINKIRECGNQTEHLNERIRDLESTLNLKQTQLDESFNHVQHLNKVIGEKDSCIGDKQKQLDESFSHVQHLNSVIADKQRQLDESFNHVQHLNHEIDEKKRQLDESFSHVQHLNKTIGEKDERLNQLNQVEQQIACLKEENQTLRQQIQSLEQLNSKVEQLNRQNEELMTKNLSLTSTLQQTEASLNHLEEMIIKREADLTNQIKKNGSNGHVSEEIYQQLEEIKRENEHLKTLLEEEIKSSKASLTERAKIRDLIKIGQDALQNEQLEFLERIDNKINGSNGH